MANVNQMIESKYLKQSDVDGDVPVTVVKVGRVNIAREGDDPDYKWMVRFEEFTKAMVLNSTNIKRMARACNSQESDDWTGKKVVLYVDPDVEFAGNVVGGLRIKALNSAHGSTRTAGRPVAGVAMDDDIPF